MTTNPVITHVSARPSKERTTSFIRVAIAILIATAIIALSGCQSALRQAAPQTAAAESGAPFVEAYLEYVGPPERWAGPRTTAHHVFAREPIARADLRSLGSTMAQAPSAFTGCLYPIRARLIRSDGSVLERQGCRDNSGWPVVVSRMVSNALETARLEKRPDAHATRLAGRKQRRIE
jgi:hypothetical protein